MVLGKKRRFIVVLSVALKINNSFILLFYSLYFSINVYAYSVEKEYILQYLKALDVEDCQLYHVLAPGYHVPSLVEVLNEVRVDLVNTKK